jgi:predicted O-linked N-acetylglucosamine transferase (SPINDLY family)
MEILALRPAPVQIGYLGFLGSTGASYIDYLIADEIVVPKGHAGHYSEKIVWMPHCYQLNHRETIPTARSFDRADWRLPDQGVVFSCFNQAYKIDTDLFDAWMHILTHVPYSVLWLYRDNHLAAEQLQSAAEERGIDRHRLVFADKVPLADHLKRLQLADIALDTLAYNGGATTSHALLAGVPVLTVLGRHWVSRMSASHIYALDLPELVTQDLAQYKKKAIDLAQSPFQLRSLKNKLKRKIDEMTLFNADLFVRHFEKGLSEIWRNYRCHCPPTHINVSALSPLERGHDDA